MERFARLWTATDLVVGRGFGAANAVELSTAAGIPADPPVRSASLSDNGSPGKPSATPWRLYVNREDNPDGRPTEVGIDDITAQRVLRAGGFVPATLEDGQRIWLLDPRPRVKDRP